MLCRRSASLTRMTRMSSTIASSILRKFSACRSSLDENGIALILVTPSTTCATSGPNSSWMRSIVRQRVLDDVVEQAGGDGDDVELHVGQEVGDLERVDEVGLARNGAPVPCARRRRRRRPAGAARRRRPGLLARTFSRRSSKRIMMSWCLSDSEGVSARAPVDGVFPFTILARFGTAIVRAVNDTGPRLVPL